MRQLPGALVCLTALALAAAAAQSQSLPAFTGIQRLANADMALSLQASTGLYCRLLVSTNLLGTTNVPAPWESVVTFLGAGAWRHTNPAAPAASARFFRAVELTGTNHVTGDHLVTTNGDVVIHTGWHASFVMNWSNRLGTDWTNVTLFVDPTNAFAGLPRADLVLVTHDHGDHLREPMILAARRPGGLLIAPQAVYNKLTNAALKAATLVLTNGGAAQVLGVGVEAVPAYNTNSNFHPKGSGNGYVLTVGGRRIYISGDTDNTPEMRALPNIDVAFLAMNQPYTMTVTNAARAVAAFRPRVVYPYHCAGSDLNLFRQLAQTNQEVEVRLRRWY